jgi:hypothetical protein
MENGMKNFFFILGILTAGYLLLRYIIPLALKFIVWTLGVFLNIIVAIAVIALIVWLIAYISRSLGKY